MKEVAIISGKGGTGKTSITAALAYLEKNRSIVDCDVDAANLSLITDYELEKEEDFIQGKKYSIDKSLCVECGKCINLCKFDAISDDYIIDPIYCEGCSVCSFFCPARAISAKENNCGKIFSAKTENGPFFHARLGPGEGNSGLLVSKLRKMNKEKVGNDEKIKVTYLDGPPGTGCPVIATITGTQAVLIVTEPSISAIHDLKRVHELANFFKIKTFVCINKADINNELSEEIKKYCRENDIVITGEIKYDPLFLMAQKEGKNIVEYSSNETVDEISKIHQQISEYINNNQGA